MALGNLAELQGFDRFIARENGVFAGRREVGSVECRLCRVQQPLGQVKLIRSQFCRPALLGCGHGLACVAHLLNRRAGTCHQAQYQDQRTKVFQQRF